MDNLKNAEYLTRRDLEEARFLTYRTFTIRLGFLVAAMPLVEMLWYWKLMASLGHSIIVAGLLTSLALSPFPTAILVGLNRKLLPWLLYGGTAAAMATILWGLARLPGGVDHLWLLLYPIIFIPVQNLPLSQRENVIGVYLVLLLPATLSWLGLVRGLPLIHFYAMALPIGVVTGYFKFNVNGIVRRNHEYRCQIEDLAQRDGLTGIYNRRHFTEEAGRALKQAQRSGRTSSLVMLDIDHFKRVNWATTLGGVRQRQLHQCMG